MKEKIELNGSNGRICSDTHSNGSHCVDCNSQHDKQSTQPFRSIGKGIRICPKSFTVGVRPCDKFRPLQIRSRCTPLHFGAGICHRFICSAN